MAGRLPAPRRFRSGRRRRIRGHRADVDAGEGHDGPGDHLRQARRGPHGSRRQRCPQADPSRPAAGWFLGSIAVGLTSSRGFHDVVPATWRPPGADDQTRQPKAGTWSQCGIGMGSMGHEGVLGEERFRDPPLHTGRSSPSHEVIPSRRSFSTNVPGHHIQPRMQHLPHLHHAASLNPDPDDRRVRRHDAHTQRGSSRNQRRGAGWSHRWQPTWSH